MKPKISIVVAMDEQRGIGINGDLPWKLPADMRFFKETTVGDKNNAVFMGRKTWESIPEKFRPLNNRKNIVLSKTSSLSHDGLTMAASIEDALSHCEDHDNVFCIGGASIYKQVLNIPTCNELIVTTIAKTFDCDAFFPDFTETFTLKETIAVGFDNGLDYKMTRWSRA